MDTSFILFLLAAFLAITLGVEGAMLLWRDRRSPAARKLKERLSALSSVGREAPLALKQRRLAESERMEALLRRLPRIGALDRWLEQSGVGWRLDRLVFLSIGVGLLVSVLANAVDALERIAPLVGLFAASVPWAWVERSRRQRLARFERQLPEVLDMMALGLRAGHSFVAVLGMVAEQAPEPTAGEFRVTFDEVNFGLPMAEALQNLAERTKVPDLHFFVVAVLLQRETGGNLAELLGNLAALVRERFKLLGRVRALAAEGVLSAWVLGLLPVGVAVFLQVSNPKYLAVMFTDDLGHRMLSIALVLMGLGVLWMRRIIRIRI